MTAQLAALDISTSAAVPEDTAYQIGRTLTVHPMHFLAPAPARRLYATNRLRQILGGRQRDGRRRRGYAHRVRRTDARRLVAALWQAEQTSF